MSAVAPWEFETPALETDPAPTLHFGAGLLFAVSAQAGTVTVIDPRRWAILRVVDLGPGSEPEDVAAISRRRAYVARRRAAELLRLDPCTGETRTATDFTPLADADGVPDLGSMLRDGRRLFVHVRRLNGDAPEGFERPAYVGIVDLGTEELIDADASADGVQGIALAGTPPKTRMQLVTQPRCLAVSASGGFFDQGGIELVDLASLESLGLVVREADGEVGADLGSFVLTKPDRGYLTYSTDLLLSSHLHRFDVSGAVDPEELHVSVDYFAPALAYDRTGQLLFVPHSFGDAGVNVFDARRGKRLTAEPIATAGAPSDLVLVQAGSRRARGCGAPEEEPPTLVPAKGGLRLAARDAG